MRVCFPMSGYTTSRLSFARQQQSESLQSIALGESNINQIESFSNILSIHQTGFASNLDHINGVSYSEEMEALSYSKILINSNLSMRAQAMDIQRSATLSLLAA